MTVMSWSLPQPPPTHNPPLILWKSHSRGTKLNPRHKLVVQIFLSACFILFSHQLTGRKTPTYLLSHPVLQILLPKKRFFLLFLFFVVVFLPQIRAPLGAGMLVCSLQMESRNRFAHWPCVCMMSLIQTAGHKMAALTVLFSRLKLHF